MPLTDQPPPRPADGDTIPDDGYWTRLGERMRALPVLPPEVEIVDDMGDLTEVET